MSKEIEEIYKDYDVNSIKWMEKNNCTTTKEITLKLMELAVQSKLSELEREVFDLNCCIDDVKNRSIDNDHFYDLACHIVSYENHEVSEPDRLSKIIQEYLNNQQH